MGPMGRSTDKSAHREFECVDRRCRSHIRERVHPSATWCILAVRTGPACSRIKDQGTSSGTATTEPLPTRRVYWGWWSQ